MPHEHDDMKHPSDWWSKWIFYLAASFYYVAVFLRSILIYQDSPQLAEVLGLLFSWLVLSISEPVISRKWTGYFSLYLMVQTALVFVLLTMPGSPDFFATLLIILSMQAMLRLNPKVGALWIGVCALVLALLLVGPYGSEAIALALIYTAANVLLGSYALTTRRAQAARTQNLELARQLQEANRQLQAYSTQLEKLAVARERNRLARELHDSVTQTIFSMSLTAQSAALLLDRDPGRVGAQLDRLSQLAHSALAEIQVLISELKPEKTTGGGLVPALRQYLADSRFPTTLSVSLEVDGEQSLNLAEEQNLCRIAQEALNNIVKHAQASRAHVRLHLAEPFWIEIGDEGQGFDLQQVQSSGGVGLASMGERATEIGWDLQIVTSPGAGTRVRAEKKAAQER